MSDILNTKAITTLHIAVKEDHEHIIKLSHALSVPDRIRILEVLLNRSMNLAEIQKELNLPMTSVSRHLDVLAEAGLIYISYEPGLKGHAKVCSQAILGFTISLDPEPKAENPLSEYSVEMPIGLFAHCHINPPCGMLSSSDKLIPYDQPGAFFNPQRAQAECLWFDRGFISYNFPFTPAEKRIFTEITFSFEICSETVYYNNKWPSDITLFINDVEILTFTSPGDFGGRRGKYTPDFWAITSTQFGILKVLTVNSNGVYLNHAFVNKKLKFDDLDIRKDSDIKFKIGIKDDATHKGGINLFGKHFGDFPQAIKMTIK